MTPHDLSLVGQGLAFWYRGRLIPVIRGGSGEDEELFAEIPADLSALDNEALQALVDAYESRVEEIAADHTVFVTDDRTAAQLLEETGAAVDALEALREELAARAAAPADVDPAAFGELAERARLAHDEEPEADEEPEPEEEPEAEVEPEASAEVVVAAAKPLRRRPPLPRPAPSRQPAEEQRQMVALTAAGGVNGMPIGDEFGSMEQVADQMIRRRGQFGVIPEGVSGEKYPIARADWRALYAEDRVLNQDIDRNMSLIAAATDPRAIRVEFDRRQRAALNGDRDSMVASGGLCAPVTPYYNLQMISVADRPVRAALPSFNADRGGLRYAQPAKLTDVTTAVGTKTAANDFAGGTEATKTCQTVPCPNFVETDVAIIYHCVKFGNLGARTFPERVTQWNGLVLSEHARTSETVLLDGMKSASTAVTAASANLGATSDLLSQVIVASKAMRSRHRMDPQAVLRLMMPNWALGLMMSDVIRSQFQRFDTDEAKITALLRSFGVEPSFYIDGATSQSQVFGTQNAGSLLAFPGTVSWFLYPEGSFIYLDGGTLELGIVRDSTLNSTNDFEIFGESFENVAFVGVESLNVISTTCDSGVVANPATPTCGTY